MKTKLLMAYFILSIGLFSCGSGGDRYSGAVETEYMELENFNKLKVEGMFNLNISQGDQESLTMKGSPEVIEKLRVTQNGDWLELSLKGKNNRFWGDNSLQIDLTLANLQELEFQGAGQIKTTQALEVGAFRIRGEGVGNIILELDADTVEADLDMVGNLELRGQTETFSLKNEGIGNIDASRLIANEVDVFSSGIGSVSVHCKGELTLEAHGIGSINYSGNPTKVNEKVSGIGKVTRN
ncbi:head GIN domain-containing protein [Pararhodonellum marinum]|uniref:head GIN domain-containing protein n=1 Tax=Pararhodonellum marinum TaxID=2755358 RepID=UPI00188E9124|nr:head GIN domain-containing protein [Pararhodonellum marinum]